jgi:hypothetical protein
MAEKVTNQLMQLRGKYEEGQTVLRLLWHLVYNKGTLFAKSDHCISKQVLSATQAAVQTEPDECHFSIIQQYDTALKKVS